MINTKYKNCGSHWAVMLEGDGALGENEEGRDLEVEQDFFGYYNHGATNGEFDWITETRGYFWTTKEKFYKAIVNRCLFQMLNEADELHEHDPDGWAHCCKGIKGGFMPQARINAQKFIDTLEQKSNILKFGGSYAHIYEMGAVSAEVGENQLPGVNKTELHIKRLLNWGGY